MTAAHLPIQRPRQAKLLVIDQQGRFRHWPRSRLVDLFRSGDLVIANDAATLPASLSGEHLESGHLIEVRLAGRDSLATNEIRHWMAVVFGAGDFRMRTEDRPQPPELATGDKKITAQGMWVEANFPSMLTLQMLKGNINGLNDPSSVLLSATVAKSFFGDADPLNKVLRIDNQANYKVAGVYEDLPLNSTLRDLEFIVPWWCEHPRLQRFVLQFDPDVLQHGIMPPCDLSHAMTHHPFDPDSDSPPLWPNPPSLSSARTAARRITAGRASAIPVASGIR